MRPATTARALPGISSIDQRSMPGVEPPTVQVELQRTVGPAVEVTSVLAATLVRRRYHRPRFTSGL
jgi:hypothetical protein